MKKLLSLIIAMLCAGTAMSQTSHYDRYPGCKISLEAIYSKIPNYDQRMAGFNSYRDSVIASFEYGEEYQEYVTAINLANENDPGSVDKANAATQKVEALSSQMSKKISEEYNKRFPEFVRIESEIRKVWGEKNNSRVLFFYDSSGVKDVWFSESTPKMIADEFIGVFQIDVERCVDIYLYTKEKDMNNLTDNAKKTLADNATKTCGLEVMDRYVMNMMNHYANSWTPCDITQEVIVGLGYE